MDSIKDFSMERPVLEQFGSVGFQASNIGEAVSLIEKMKREKATIFLSFTANLIASGLRGIIAEICRKKFVDAIITTAGSIDHDIIKTLLPYQKGSFGADDAELHKKGISRIGNIFVPAKGFELLEGEMQKWLEEWCSKKSCFPPSEISALAGSKLESPQSFLHWCSKNKIPVFCPGITDGAIGLQFYFFLQQHKDFCINAAADLTKLGQIVLDADKTGGIVLGGGISKHHLIGANILRDGLDYAVYISTATELDGSLSGARTHEAKSWGKLREKAENVNVFCDATIAFPLIAESLRKKKIL
ncbi:MAG: deoxyhypusine synthase [Candidatus Diapherotrites archaeon]|uniref:Deoxyhypusine synthase n=1 Tax=Candidatus Iainarchaeum sp. TaxID=3101447 RepID=A0A938YTJ7_9ARCH|nr:deoxyhypusine synthase [Candidatus Diapherotrites archaeon]